MKRIILKKGEERRILGGHPWVYDNEIEMVLEDKGDAARNAALVNGECADVESWNKRYLGRALVNPLSKIRARIYSPSKEGIDTGFFKRRIREAVLRRDIRPCASSRLVFAEADFLPGLIIDRYSGWELAGIHAAHLPFPLDTETVRQALGNAKTYLAIQFLTLAMDMRRDSVLAALDELIPELFEEDCAAVIEKSTASVRVMEGLEPREEILKGGIPAGDIVIFENNYPFTVSLEHGQKTGHFLDQRENRLRVHALAGNKQRVLDVFSYSGGFAVHCARAGAGEVIAVDASKSALSLLEQNAQLNGVRLQSVCADAFDILSKYQRMKERFDLIILDPPAFAKSRKTLSAAIAGYKEINMKALSMLRPGGILVSCSCSFALEEKAFKRIILDAAQDAGRVLVQTDFRGQSACHPVLVGYDESNYLKCGIYTVIR